MLIYIKGDFSRRNGLIKSHTIFQFNELSYLNKMNQGGENCDVSGIHCQMNIHTVLEAKDHNSVDSTKKRDGNSPNISAMEKYASLCMRNVISL